jgi:hypothetical protein
MFTKIFYNNYQSDTLVFDYCNEKKIRTSILMINESNSGKIFRVNRKIKFFK